MQLIRYIDGPVVARILSNPMINGRRAGRRGPPELRSRRMQEQQERQMEAVRASAYPSP